MVAHVDSAFLAEIKSQAQAELSRFIELFGQRVANPGYRFSVKAPLTEDGKTEHMWIRVSTLEGSNISGRLANAPAILKSVKLGDTVQCAQEQIEDLVITDEQNKVVLGGFHAKYLERRREDDRKARLK